MALRRQVKNVVRNFTDVEVKVREATSNDPWGPSSSLMGEIADATYNVTAFSSIMSMLWKRLNDHGKNWRHVYKSLTVLDYIIKTGSERVAQQCRENLFAIQTLKDFQFIDKDGKDQGINVREKSKQIVALLKDDERLKNERQRSLKAKERFAQSQGGVGNKNFPKQNKKFTSSYPTTSESFDKPKSTQDDSSIPSSSSWHTTGKSTEFDSRSTDGRVSYEFEKARPTNEQEEEMQLQIALAMSREEAEQDKKMEMGDEKRLAMALQESHGPTSPAQPSTSTLLDLTAPAPNATSASFDAWASPAAPTNQFNQAPQMNQPAFAPTNQVSDNPWGASQNNPQQPFDSNPSVAFPTTSDPWSSNQTKDPFTSAQPDPWGGNTQPAPDPWGNVPASQPVSVQSNSFAMQPDDSSSSNGFDPRAVSNSAPQLSLAQGNPFDMSTVNTALVDTDSEKPFLGTSSRLVNLDDIAGTKASDNSVNPFATTVVPKTTNPFASEKPKAKSINELRSQQTSFVQTPENLSSNDLLPSPLIPQTSNTQSSNNSNPFLL